MQTIQNLSLRAKLLIIGISIFLISLSVGMLILAANNPDPSNLKTNLIESTSGGTPSDLIAPLIVPPRN